MRPFEADATQPACRRYPSRGAAVLAVYALVGPALGAVVLVAIFSGLMLINASASAIIAGSLTALAQVLMFFGVMAYPFGGLSAVMAGGWLGWRAYRHGSFGYREAALVSGLASVVGVLVMLLLAGQQTAGNLGVAASLTPLGIASGLVCRWLLGRLGLVG